MKKVSTAPRQQVCATRWCVFTGAPCSGKTTVLDALEKRGFIVIPETARAYVEKERKKGRTVASIRKNPLLFQRHILYSKVYTEKRLPPQELIFLDRGLPDSIAYFRLSNLPMDEPVTLSRKRRYGAVFLFQRLPLKPDPVRREDDATAARIEGLIRDAYRSLGYAPIHVPIMSVADRVDFILNHLPAAL